MLARVIELYEQAIELDPRLREALYALAVIYTYEQVDLPRARTLVYRAMNEWQGEVKTMFLAAAIAVLQGNREEAIDWYGKIMESLPGTAEYDRAYANREELLRSR